MENFLINFSICLFSLWLVYKLLLENTSWHQFKRFYLLGALVASAVIPFLVVRTVVIPFEPSAPLAFPLFTGNETTVVEQGFALDWSDMMLVVYVVGVLVMGFRFTRNLLALKITATDEITNYQHYTLVLRKLVQVPHSFFNRIYAGQADYKARRIPESVLQHEKAHLDQKHSWDILSIEILLIVMWFNPLLWLLEYSIKLNHEFLADQAVLADGVATKTYQETLLAYSSNSQQRSLANTFNFPIIKKRFTIMKTHTTTVSGLLRSLAIVPVLALLVMSCGQEETEFIEVEETIIVEDDLNDKNVKLIVVDPDDPNRNITINGKPHFYKIKGDQIDIYNKDGDLQDFQSQGYEVRLAEVIEVSEILENLTESDIAEYNRLAIKNRQISDNGSINYKINDEILKMQTIYNSMTAAQKKRKRTISI